MNAKQIGLSVILADFSALTAYAVYQHGYAGFFELLFANWATATVFVDLCIALALIIAWMWRDARRRGLSPLPYAALTLALGSVGPLLYLIRRAGTERTEPARVGAGFAVGR
jgi:MFS superfamily sulfate permease-like transporter